MAFLDDRPGLICLRWICRERVGRFLSLVQLLHLVELFLFPPELQQNFDDASMGRIVTVGREAHHAGSLEVD